MQNWPHTPPESAPESPPENENFAENGAGEHGEDTRPLPPELGAPSDDLAPDDVAQIERESAIESESGAEKSGQNSAFSGADWVEPDFSNPDSRQGDYANFELIFVEWKRSGDPKLRERMIFMHRNLVTYLARRFVERGDLYEDIVQVGMMALINAIDNFSLERGVKFSTFAIPSISGEIRRYFRDKVNGMRVPRRLQELHLAIHPHVEIMTQRLKRAPTYAEIAFELQIEVEEVVEALELGSALEPGSLDDFMYQDSESGSIADSIGAPDPNLTVYEEHSALQAALERLTEKERKVLELAYFEGHSQAEIARQLGVSQMHISRLLRKSLAQLRVLLEEV